MGCGNVYVTVNYDNEDIVREVFVKVGKSGGCQNCWAISMGRVVSVALQDAKKGKTRIAKTLLGVSCPSAQPGLKDDPDRIMSCMDGLARILMEQLENTLVVIAEKVPEENESRKMASVGLCPDCGGPIYAIESCKKCLTPGCGYAVC
jgi:hypothetical protein